MKKKTIPKASLHENADRMISVLEAFKNGQPVQRKTNTQNWHDFDLTPFLNGDAVKYRVKPIRQ
jgi:hypothetical protein